MKKKVFGTLLLVLFVITVIAVFRKKDIQAIAYKSATSPPEKEDGFFRMPLKCEGDSCSFTLRLLPYLYRDRGILDWILADSPLAPDVPKEVLLTVESLSDGRRTIFHTEKISIEKLMRDTTRKITIPMPTADTEVGLFLCRDWNQDLSCHAKKIFDIPTRVENLKWAASHKAEPLPDSIYVFSYLYLSKSEGKALVYGGYPTQRAARNMAKHLASLQKLTPPAQPEIFLKALRVIPALEYVGLRRIKDDYVLLVTHLPGATRLTSVK